jgi:hypothetical protein
MNRTVLAAVWPPSAAAARMAGHEPMSPMEAIRRKCLDCCCGQVAEVKLCEAVACLLWPFRSGRHPYTRTRLQEADLAASRAGGAETALMTRLYESDFSRSALRKLGAVPGSPQPFAIA